MVQASLAADQNLFAFAAKKPEALSNEIYLNCCVNTIAVFSHVTWTEWKIISYLF